MKVSELINRADISSIQDRIDKDQPYDDLIPKLSDVERAELKQEIRSALIRSFTEPSKGSLISDAIKKKDGSSVLEAIGDTVISALMDPTSMAPMQCLARLGMGKMDAGVVGQACYLLGKMEDTSDEKKKYAFMSEMLPTSIKTKTDFKKIVKNIVIKHPTLISKFATVFKFNN